MCPEECVSQCATSDLHQPDLDGYEVAGIMVLLRIHPKNSSRQSETIYKK